MKQDADDMTLKPFDFSQILEEVPEMCIRDRTWSLPCGRNSLA